MLRTEILAYMLHIVKTVIRGHKFSHLSVFSDQSQAYSLIHVDETNLKFKVLVQVALFYIYMNVTLAFIIIFFAL